MVSSETVAELKHELVVMSSDLKVMDWVIVAVEVQKCLKLKFCPKVLVINIMGALLNVKSLEVNFLNSSHTLKRLCVLLFID